MNVNAKREKDCLLPTSNNNNTNYIIDKGVKRYYRSTKPVDQEIAEIKRDIKMLYSMIEEMIDSVELMRKTHEKIIIQHNNNQQTGLDDDDFLIETVTPFKQDNHSSPYV